MLERRTLGGLLLVLVLAACSAGSPSASPAPSSTLGVASASPVPATEAASPSVQASQSADLHLVAVGDSIPYNSADDCPGCTGFVERYADALAAATGRSVDTQNLSAHANHTIDDLLRDLSQNTEEIEALSAADAIIVGIAHNDVPMNRDDDACDGAGGDNPVWSRFTDACIASEVARFSPKYSSAFQQIATLREGKPTILRAINRYNDWNGWPGHELPTDGVAATARVIAAWNDMLCGAAEASGFTCGDISTAFNGASGRKLSGDLLAADYTHPSEKGNEAIAKVLVELGFAPIAP